MRESQRVDERVTPIDGIEDFKRELREVRHARCKLKYLSMPDSDSCRAT